MNFKEIESTVLGVSTRTITTGVVGAGLTYYLIDGNQGSLDLMGYNVPSWAIFAVVYGVAGGWNESLKRFMEKYTPVTAPLYRFSPVSTGVTAALVMYLVGVLAGAPLMPSFSQLAIPFGIGAVSDVSAGFLTDSLIDPIMNVKKINEVNKALIPEPHILGGFSGSFPNFNTVLGEQLLF